MTKPLKLSKFRFEWVDWVQGAIKKLWYTKRGGRVPVRNEGRVVFGVESPTDGTLNPMAIDSSGHVQVDNAAITSNVITFAGNASGSIGIAGEVWEIHVIYVQGAGGSTITLLIDAVEASSSIVANANTNHDLDDHLFPITGDAVISVDNGTSGATVNVFAKRRK